LTTLLPAQMLYSSAVVKERYVSKELCVRQVCSHHRHCRICRLQAISSSLLSCARPHETLETP